MHITFSGTTVSTASNFHLICLVDAINQMTFQVPRTEYDTWIARMDQDVLVYHGTDFLGTCYIKSIVKSFGHLTITCQGQLGKLQWWMVPELSSRSWYDKGKVHSVSTTTLTLYDQDGADELDFTNDQYNNEYLIVSEGTTEDETKECVNGANDYIGHSEYKQVTWTPSSGNYTNIKKTTTTSKMELHNLSTTGTHKYFVNLNIGYLNIPDSATILKMTVVAGGTHSVYCPNYPNKRFWFDLVGGTAYDSSAFAFIFEPASIKAADGEKEWGITVDITNDLSRVFTTSGGIYVNGAIGILYYASSGGGSLGDDQNYSINWNRLTVSITYRTATFDEINVIITDTVATNQITTATNFAAAGVAENDLWVVCKSLNAAFEAVFAQAAVSVPYNINKGNSFGRGVSSEYLGITALTYAQHLCDQKDCRYFEDTSSGASVIEFCEEQYLDVESTPLTDFKNIENFETEDNIYGYIDLASEAGTVSVPVPGSSNPKHLVIMKKGVRTTAELFRQATDLATKYSTFRRSICLEWDSYILLRVGHKYTFTVDGTEYTDQICRKVEYSHDGAYGKCSVVAYFGGGNTPMDEKIGRKIGLLGRSQNIDDGLKYTTSYAPITRYSQLSGIPSSFTPAAHTQAESTITSSITAGNLIKSDGSKLADSGITVDTSTDLDGASASDSKVPSQLAVKTYVDAGLRYVELTPTPSDWHGNYLTSTNNVTVELDFVNGGSANKDANITETVAAVACIPSTAKAIQLSCLMINDTANSGNQIVVRNLDLASNFSGFNVLGNAANSYYSSMVGTIGISASAKHILVKFYRGAGNIRCYFNVLGYWI